MAPKRKAAGSPETKAATKRTTAAKTSNAKTNSSKAIETIHLDSSDEDEIPPVPAKKKAAPAKRAARKPAASKATPAAPPSVEAPASTSTTPVPDVAAKKSTSKAKPAAKPRATPVKPPAKKKVAVPPKPKDWDTLCREMFEKFALAGEEDDEEDVDEVVLKTGAPPERMEGGAIQKLFEEIDFGMEGIHPFLLAYKLKAAAFGSFSLKEWMDGFRAEQIGTTARIKTSIVELQKSLYPTSAALAALPSYLRSTSKSEFKKFYVYLFNLLREEGQKSLGAETALVIWGVVLKDYKGKEEGAVFVPEDDDEVDSEDEDSEMARAKLASMQDAAASKADSGSDEAGGKLIQEFIEYGTSLGPNFKGVSSDVWNQLLDFLDCVGPDLQGYEDDSAWPSMLDSFVEWKREKDAANAK